VDTATLVRVSGRSNQAVIKLVLGFQWNDILLAFRSKHPRSRLKPAHCSGRTLNPHQCRRIAGFMLNGVHNQNEEKTPRKTIPSYGKKTRLNRAQCPRDRVTGRQRSSQHGKRGAARAAAPEDGVGEGEPSRRGGHERAHEHPVHGAGAPARKNNRGLVLRDAGLRAGVVSTLELEWEAAWGVGSGGRERRSGGERWGFSGVSGRGRQ